MFWLLKLESSLRILSLVASVFFLAACANDEGNRSLRVGTNVWPGYEPLYLADYLGYFDGKPISLVEYSSASQVARAFRNDLIDAAALTLDEVLLLAQYDFEPEIVLVMDISHGGDVILARPEFGSMENLKGHRVGVESTAVGSFVMTRALQIAGMNIDDVITVPVEVDEHVSAYNSGNVEAVVTFEPVRSRLLKLGAKLVFDSSQIPGEIVDVLVVRRAYLKKGDASVIDLINGWYEALNYMSQQKVKSMQQISKRLHLSENETSKSFEGLKLPDKKANKRMLLEGDQGDAALLASARKLLEVMTERELVRRPVEPESLFQYIQDKPKIHE